MSFLPPSSDQLRSLSDLVTLIDSLSKAEVKDAIKQMQDLADAAHQDRVDAANDKVAAQALSDKIDKAAADNKAIADKLIKDNAALDVKAQTVSDAQAALKADAAQLKKDKDAFAAETAKTTAALNERAASVDDREKALAFSEAEVNAKMQEYQTKLDKLKTLAA